jgi:hypothetical protein
VIRVTDGEPVAGHATISAQFDLPFLCSDPDPRAAFQRLLGRQMPSSGHHELGGRVRQLPLASCQPPNEIEADQP